jgi:glucose/arabinose dehydrogenase
VTTWATRRARRGTGLTGPGPRPRSLFARLYLAPAALIAIALVAGCGSARTGARLVPIGSGLRGPAALEATVYARGLRRMSAFAFDRRGRLWVTTSAATDHNSDALYMVSGPGARPVKVVPHLKGPLGLTSLGNTLYVASIGRVEAYSDLRAGRFAKRTTILNGPVEDASNENIIATPGGRLMMSVSTTCDHCTPRSNWSATIVTFRSDGSDVRLYAKGIRAGFGLTYYPGTSDLFVSMNQRDDLGGRTPGDWVAVVKKGQDWSFPACYGQGGGVCANVPRPIGVLDKHAAAGGLAIVTGQLGPSVGTAALVAEWRTGTVKRVALTRSGSSYRGSTAALLTGLRNPLPVVTTGDGAVLVGDWTTGIVYRVARR